MNVIAPVAVSPRPVQFGDITVGKPPSSGSSSRAGQPFKVLDFKGVDEQVVLKSDSGDARPSTC